MIGLGIYTPHIFKYAPICSSFLLSSICSIKNTSHSVPVKFTIFERLFHLYSLPIATKQVKTTQVSSPPANTPASSTPPVSPALESIEPKITSTEKQTPIDPQSDRRAEPKREIRRASKLAFETVDGIYVIQKL